VQTTTEADGSFFFTDGIGTHGPALGPVQWDFNYDVPNFAHLGEQITLAPGSAPIHNVVLARQRNTIQGTTFTRFGTATAVAENGVAVEIKNVSNAADVHTTTSPTVSGGATGSYSVTGLLNGSYFVKFTKAGYADSTEQVSVQNGQVFSQVGTIQVVPVQTTVTVRSAVTNGANNIFISGTTVTLTPKPSPAQRSPDTYTAVTDSSGVASFNQVLPSTYVVTISAAGGHLTALDVTEKTINIGDASATQTVIIQEARIFGRVLVQDTSTTPTTGTAGLTVNMYTGATAVGTPVAITTTTDTTENAVAINFLRYVASSVNGYTFTAADGADHTTSSVTISNPFGASFKTVNVGTVTLKKLASLTVTVQGHNDAGALVNVTDATVTVTQGGTEYDPDSPGSYSFSNLPPSVTITIEASKHHDAVPATTQTSPPSIIVAGIDARDEQGSNTITLNPGQAGVVTVTMTNCPHTGC
jgi:hypothetical protein